MPIDLNARLSRHVNHSDPIVRSPDVTRHKGEILSVQSDGTATINIDGDPEPVAGVHSAANYIPKTGDYVDVVMEDTEASITGKFGTSPTVFRNFQAAAAVAASETRAATTFGDLASAGPSVSVTVGESGILLVGIAAEIATTSDNDGGAVGVAISGATTVAATLARCLKFYALANGGLAQLGRTLTFTDLNPGAHTVTMKYSDLLDTGADVAYGNRELWAMPL